MQWPTPVEAPPDFAQSANGTSFRSAFVDLLSLQKTLVEIR
jgi:hypothetical protein